MACRQAKMESEDRERQGQEARLRESEAEREERQRERARENRDRVRSNERAAYQLSALGVDGVVMAVASYVIRIQGQHTASLGLLLL